MSLEHIELHRQVVIAFNARDLEGFLRYCHPSIELHSVFAAVGGAIYHGHDGIRKWFRDFDDSWEDVTAGEETYFDLGDDILAFYVLRGRGRQSGVQVEMENALVARWVDGRMTYFRVYREREEALSDLGVSLEELEPVSP